MYQEGKKLRWKVGSEDSMIDLHQEPRDENEKLQYTLQNWEGKEKQ